MNKHIPYKFESTGLTDVGCVRSRNEDNILLRPDEMLWVVADGAGGHSDGDIASQLIIDNLQRFKNSGRLGSDVKSIYATLNTTNNKLLELGQSNKIIGSTVSAFISDGNVAVIIWAGDSPLYRLRENVLVQITEDHNRTEEFLRQGFSKEECINIPQTQHLARALGATSPLAVETRILELRDGDLFLICSDGLNKELSNQDISNILDSTTNLEEKQKGLIQLTLSRGARDNTSIVLIKVFSD